MGHRQILQQIASDNEHEQLRRSQAENMAREAQLKDVALSSLIHIFFLIPSTPYRLWCKSSSPPRPTV